MILFFERLIGEKRERRNSDNSGNGEKCRRLENAAAAAKADLICE